MCPDRRSLVLDTRCTLAFRDSHSLAKIVETFSQRVTQIGSLTFLGPVIASDHSMADSLMCRRGSIQDTAKYIEIDMV